MIWHVGVAAAGVGNVNDTKISTNQDGECCVHRFHIPLDKYSNVLDDVDIAYA